ncbi:hypothetical protein QUF72_09545 [Desulfobacterales bacterium HSG2]|nr:hypothetical protein [Desulfobacterales bacterium HSG2]
MKGSDRSRSVRIAKAEPLAGECLRGIYQSSASVEGMPAHARFGLPNPNPGRQASVCGGFANPPRALEGYVRSRSVRIAKSEPL